MCYFWIFGYDFPYGKIAKIEDFKNLSLTEIKEFYYNFYDLSNMIDALDKSVKSLNLKLPVARKCYFFRHWSISHSCYHNKYTNSSDLAMHMGDLDLKFINSTYIKKYTVANTE